MNQAGEMGFLGVAFPEATVGLGMGFVSNQIVCEYISGSGSLSNRFWCPTRVYGLCRLTLYGQ